MYNWYGEIVNQLYLNCFQIERIGVWYFCFCVQCVMHSFGYTFDILKDVFGFLLLITYSLFNNSPPFCRHHP